MISQACDKEKDKDKQGSVEHCSRESARKRVEQHWRTGGLEDRGTGGVGDERAGGFEELEA